MTECELCGEDDSIIVSREIREGPGIIRQCNRCGLIYQDIEEKKEELYDYYNKNYQETNSLRSGYIQSPLEHFIDRYPTIVPTFENILPHLNSEMDIMEVGCGSGELLYMINPNVNSALGVELNHDFVEFIKNSLNINAYCEDLNEIDFKDKKFDLIICIMTLDHLPNPKETLLTMKRLLKKNGRLYLEVPNVDEALNQYIPEPMKGNYQRFFWHKAHYYYFSKDTLSKFLNSIGMSCEIKCHHQYTLKNFLNWYFTGMPQNNFFDAAKNAKLFLGNSRFEEEMNEIFEIMDLKFKKILKDTNTGDSLYCFAMENDLL